MFKLFNPIKLFEFFKPFATPSTIQKTGLPASTPLAPSPAADGPGTHDGVLRAGWPGGEGDPQEFITAITFTNSET